MKKKYSKNSTYVVKLTPLEKALLDYVNKKYMFYEFLVDKYCFLFKAIPKHSKRVYIYIPAWLYELLRSMGITNSISIYLDTVIIKNLFNAYDVYDQQMKRIRVYDTIANFFGRRITVPEMLRDKVEQLASSSYANHPTKVFSAYSRIAKHLRWCKKRYGLTRRNALLLYLAYFVTAMKERMVR